MKFNKKFLSLLFVAFLAIALVGCNGEETTTEAPTTEAPTTQAPTTEAPTTEAPTTEAPTTEAPTTEAPTTEAVDFQPAINYLEEQYADTLLNDDFVATEDLTLLNVYLYYLFSWSSSDTDLVENDGTINRPLLSEGDQTAILTVTITKDGQSMTQDFFVTVKALEEKTADEIADEVFLYVFAIPNNEFWTSANTLNLVDNGEDNDGNEYPVTWSTTHPEYITTEGVITQPEGEDVDVTLTATITIDGTEFSEERVFTVAKMAEATVVSTIAEAIALGQDAYVEIPGVTVIAMYNSGDVFFTDGTDILYIYSPPFAAEVGGVYDITGSIDFYYNAPQLAGSDSRPLRAAPSTAAVSSAPVVEVTGIEDIIAATSVPSTENPHVYVQYEVTAKVYYEESWGNYSLFLVPTDYDFDAELATGATQPNGDAIMIYYRSDMDVLKAFHGKEITIDIVMQGYRTDKTVFYANFFGTAMDVDAVIADDTEAVNTAVDALLYPETIVDDTTLNLPTSLYGVNLTWTSSHDSVIDPMTGLVAAEAQIEQVMVTLTVNAERNGVTGTKTFEIGVGEMPVTTISDLLAETEGTFRIQGTVISGEYQNTYFIQDATGNIALYTDGNAAIEGLLNDNIGNVVDIVGTRAAYRGLEQVRVASVEYIEDGSIPAPTNLDSLELTEAVLADYQGQLIELTNMIVTDKSSDNYGNVYLTLTHPVNGTTIDVKWDSRVSLPTELNSDLQSVSINEIINIQAILAWNDGPLIYIVTTAMIEEVELTTEQKVAADMGSLDFGGNVFEATDVTLPATGSNGSAITWAITSGEANATLTDGVLSLAAVTAEATVEITATLTLDGIVETATFTYTLMNVTMVDLGDFENQTLGNVVGIHGVVYAVIGNGFFVEDATGQLFVFSYDAEYAVGDEVELIGEVAEYSGSYQLSNLIDLPEALSTGNDVEMEAQMYEDGVTTLEAGQLYTVTGTVAIEGQYDNVYIYINATDSFEVYYRSPDASIAALEAMVGETVAVDMIYYNGGDTFAYTGGTDGVRLYAEVTDFSDLYAMTDGTNYDLPNGSLVKITGVVTGNSYDGLFIQDTAGQGFFLYRPVGDGDRVIGEEVTYIGEMSSYNDARQLGYGADFVETVSTGNTLVVTSVTADEIHAFGIEDAGTLYSFDGFTLDSIDGSTMTLGYTLADGVTTGTVTIRYFSNWDDLATVTDYYEVGDALPVVEFIVYNYRDDKIQLDVVSVDFTDADYIQFDAADLPGTLSLTEDYVIPTAEFGSTYEVTAMSTSLDGYIDYTTTPGTLAVTQPAIGEADVTGTVTMTVSLGTETSIDVVVDVTVEAEVDPSATTTYTENFSTFVGSGTSYTTETFTGDSGFEWTVTNSRKNLGGYEIDGGGIMFKNGTMTSTVTDGIGSLSLDILMGFTGGTPEDRTIEIYVDGTLVGSHTLSTTTVETLTINDINVSGGFTLVIENAGGDRQIVINNLEWTSYSPAE